jgi:predicted nuclease of predicted toxin-antitoxin system
MKVLIDQNISHRILTFIQNDLYNFEHVRNVGLKDANDYEIFMYARNNNFDSILTLDEDFQFLLLTQNQPPKIIWIKVGNCPTKILAELINNNSSIISFFLTDENSDCLEIYN